MGAGPPSDGEQRLQVEMYHVHLPQLEDYGYIQWDEYRNEVSKRPRFEGIRPLLELLASDGAEQSVQ